MGIQYGIVKHFKRVKDNEIFEVSYLKSRTEEIHLGYIPEEHLPFKITFNPNQYKEKINW